MTQVIRDRALAHSSFCALFDGVANKRLVIEEMFVDPLNPAEDRREYRMYVRQVFNPMAGSEGNSRSVNEALDGNEPDFSAHIDELAHNLLNRKMLVIKSERRPLEVEGWDEIKLLVRANPDFTSNPHSLNEATCSRCFDAMNRANGLEKRAKLAEADFKNESLAHAETETALVRMYGDSLVDQICKSIDDWRARVDPDVRVSEIWSAFEEIADKLNEGVKEHTGPKLAVDNDQAAHDALRDMLEKPFPGYGTFIVDDLRYSDEYPTPAERAAADAWQANHELGTAPGKIPPRPFMPQQDAETDYAFRKRVRLAAIQLTGASPARLSAIDIAIGKTLDMFGQEYGLVRHKPIKDFLKALAENCEPMPDEIEIGDFKYTGVKWLAPETKDGHAMKFSAERVCPADLMLSATQPIVSGFDMARDGSDHGCTATFRVNEAGGLDLIDTEFHAGPEPIRPREEQPVVQAVVNADQPELWDLYRLACEEFNREPSPVLAWKVTAAFRRWAEAFCKMPFPGMTVEQSINQMVARLTGELLAKTASRLDGGGHAKA